MVKESIITLFTLIALSTCGPPKPDPKLPTDTHNCDDACTKLKSLGCEEGEPLEDGTSCVEFCTKTQESGHALNPSCVMTIKSCDELEPKCLEK